MRAIFRTWLTLLTAHEWGVHGEQGEPDWAVEAAEVPAKHKIDAEWRDYVHTLVPDYEEDATEPTSSSQHPTREPVDWAPLKYGEVPFLAVIYKADHEGPSDRYKQSFPGEPNPGLGHIEPGKACGGAIITRRTLITVCGCIMTLVARILNSKQFHWLFPKHLIPYDIDDSTHVDDRIFMTHSVIKFRPDFAHQIDPKTGWNSPNMPPTMNCRKIFRDALSWGDEMKSAVANSQVVLAHFKPDIGHPLTGQFPNWPPPAFDYLINKEIELARLNLVSIGMRMTVYTKFQFFSSIQASSLVSKFCHHVDSLNCKAKRKSLLNPLRYVCLCPAYGNKYDLQLTGGVIGWPVIYPNGSLVGLSATDRHSADGGFLVTWLSPDTVLDIQQYLTEDILLEQNNLTKTYREKDLDKSWNIYDYGFIHAPTPKSSASVFGPPSLAHFSIFMTVMKGCVIL